MKKLTNFLWVALIASFLHACQKEVIPTARFSYEVVSKELKQYYPSVFPVQEPIQFYNQSTEGTSSQWDFGDGTTSTVNEPVVFFKKSGTYTVRLTTVSATGARTTSTQSITVANRILKRITVNRLMWNAFGNLVDWKDPNKRADLRIDLGTLPNGGLYTQPGKVLYQTEPVKNVANTTTGFTVPVAQKVVLNPDVFPYNFMLNVYGNDGHGDQIAYSTRFGGTGFSFGLSSDTRLYTFKTGLLGTSVTIESGYE